MSEQYLLDTCAWLDLKLAPQRVNEKTVEIARAQSILHLASISLMEVTRKSAAGLLVLNEPIARWMEAATSPKAIRLLEITNAIAIDAYSLPGNFHKDPADRLIVATARLHQLTIITCDRKILAYPHVRTLSSR
jgi:PIN domain nuclease of toxin-antitoxin system